MARAVPVKIAIIANAAQAKSVFSKTADQAKSWGAKVTGVVKNVAKVGAAGGLALIGTALNKGFKRLNNIDTAKTKLDALGYSTKEIERMMKSADKAVTGTAFGLDEAAVAASSAAAAGVKHGKTMDAYLTTIADVASITGQSMTEIGAITNKVQANQKVSQNEINQLNNAGIGIGAKLAKHYKVSAGELRKMVASGKVDAKTFNKVLGDMTAGASQKMGTTIPAMIANIWAAIGRIGAAFLENLFPAMKSGLGKVLTNLRAFETKAKDFAKKLSNALEGVVAWFKDLDLSGLTDALASLGASARNAFDGLKEAAAPAKELIANIWTIIGPLVKTLTKVTLGAGFIAVKVALEAVGKVTAPLVKTLAKTTGFITRHSKAFKILGGILGAAVLPVVAGLTVALVTQATTVAVTKAAWLAYGVISKGMAAASKAMAAAQWLVNTAMLASPITWVVVGLVALVAAIVFAIKHWDKIAEVVSKVWESIKAATSKAKDWLVKTVKKIPSALVAFFKNWSLPGLIVKHWDKIKSVFTKGIAKLVAWMKALPGKLVAAVGGLGTKLAGKGRALLSGLRNGITGFWSNKLRPWLRDMPTKIVSAVGGLGGKLVGAATDLMGGFLGKIREKFQDVKDTLGKLTDLLPDWKGPASKDKKILRGPADLVMDGLINQLEKRRKNLRTLMGQITRDIETFGGRGDPHLGGEFALAGTAMTTGRRQGNRVININVTAPLNANRAELGREIAGALADYERAGGRR